MRAGLLVAGALSLCACTQHRVGYVAKPAVGPRGAHPIFERQVINAHYAGEGDYTLRSLQARLAAEPDNLPLRLELARHYEGLGSRELALEHYRLAASRFPDSAAIPLAMAKCLRAMGLRAEAAGAIDRFLERHPQSRPDLCSWLGIIRDELGQWDRGEAAHRAALRLAPEQDRLHNNLGYNLLQQKKFAEAAQEFRQALALAPDSVVARNNLGLALAAQPAEALRSWEKTSDRATAHSNLAAVLIEQGRHAEARKEVETALGYNRSHQAALANLRLIAELDGKPTGVPAREARPRWKRFWSAFWKELVGIEEPRQTTVANHATR